jgi:dTDP-4-dehydrorhamnose reductase
VSDKPHLLILGARGFLGQHLAIDALSVFRVFQANLPAAGWQGLTVDITSGASVEAGFREALPSVVVLFAATSDIDLCEADPQRAEQINVGGAAHVVESCARSGAKLIFTSSAAVFDGTRHGYREGDEPRPLSVYGRTKVRAEQLVLRTLPTAIVLRLALVLGFAQNRGTNALLNKLAEKLGAGESVTLPEFEYRNPIDAGTLANFMLELIKLPGAGGVYHLGADEAISRFELGKRLARKMGFSSDLILPQTAPVQGRAPRGLDHFLLTERVRAVCRTPVPSCDEVIERAVNGSPQACS